MPDSTDILNPTGNTWRKKMQEWKKMDEKRRNGIQRLGKKKQAKMKRNRESAAPLYFGSVHATRTLSDRICKGSGWFQMTVKSLAPSNFDMANNNPDLV